MIFHSVGKSILWHNWLIFMIIMVKNMMNLITFDNYHYKIMVHHSYTMLYHPSIRYNYASCIIINMMVYHQSSSSYLYHIIPSASISHRYGLSCLILTLWLMMINHDWCIPLRNHCCVFSGRMGLLTPSTIMTIDD